MIKCIFPKLSVGFLLLAVTFSLTARGKPEYSITIAEQYGLAYAPLQIMAQKGFLEILEPEWEINWVKLGNTAAIREAVLAGRVDAGFLGIPPFLISRDKGMEWKIATAISQSPLGLVVKDGIEDFDDFSNDKRIALPQPGSIQHILLTMALKRQYNDPSYLDRSLISLKHPDGMNALLSGSLEAHFTSPPYLFQELDQEGFSQLISGEQAMGEPFTFIVGVVTEDFYSQNREFYFSFIRAINMALEFINKNHQETVRLLSPLYDMEESLLNEYLYERGMIFESEVRGLHGFIKFMRESALIENIENSQDVLF